MKTEYFRVAAMLFGILALGLITGRWVLAVLVPAFAYIAFTLFKLDQLDHWLSRGARKSRAPESDGLWEHLVTAVLQRKKKGKERQTRLSKMVKNYRNTVLALPDGAVVLNNDLEIQWVNAPAQRFLGLSPVSDIGFRITNLIRVPKFVSHIDARESKPLEIQSPLDSNLILSIRVVRFGQDQRLLLARDISERIRSRQAQQHFVANASHELKTPLTVTSGYIDMVLDDPELPEHLRSSMQKLRDQTDDMVDLIDDLLTLSKVEGAGFEASEEQSIDVTRVIEAQISALKKRLPENAYHFVLKLDSKLKLRGLLGDIKSICGNLIENAVKHNAHGTTITVNWQQLDAQQARLTVSDDGDGMDASQIPLITQRFYRINANDDDQRKGSGLGLAIVKHGVTQHDGELEIESKIGEGTDFMITFAATRTVMA